MASDKYTAQQMIDALEATKGMITVAARRLGCAPNTVRRYIVNYPTVAEAQVEARAALGDQVELTLATMALGERDTSGRYTREPNITALIFLAKTIYKDRGYVERQEWSGPNGGPVQVEHRRYKDITDAELATILGGTDDGDEDA
jgi:hypothetical protein